MHFAQWGFSLLPHPVVNVRRSLEVSATVCLSVCLSVCLCVCVCSCLNAESDDICRWRQMQFTNSFRSRGQSRDRVTWLSVHNSTREGWLAGLGVYVSLCWRWRTYTHHVHATYCTQPTRPPNTFTTLKHTHAYNSHAPGILARRAIGLCFACFLLYFIFLEVKLLDMQCQ